MEAFQNRRNYRFRMAYEDSEDEYSCDDDNLPRPTRNPRQNFSQLFQARSRFSQFAEGLGDMRHSQLREDVLCHCQQSSKREKLFQRFMSDETILGLINLRIDKMIKNKRIKKNWSEQDVQILVWITSKYADQRRYRDIDKEIDDQDWQAISRLIPGVTGESCMFKWLSLKKTNLATNNWSKQESDLLGQLVREKAFERGGKKDSKDWKLISQRLYFLNGQHEKIFRNAKQCREHWNCYLNPNLKKGPWRLQQDIQLLRCIQQNKGSKKWSEIVKHFDGRTQNALKNRYTLIIEKQKKQQKHKSQMQIVKQFLVKCYVDQFTNEVGSPEDRSEKAESIECQSPEQAQRSISFEVQSEGGMMEAQRSNSSAPVTPVKIEVVKDYSQFFSMRNIDMGNIQMGKLSNGIFEKTTLERASSMTSLDQTPKLRKMHSMF